jgi:Zn-dependent protease with chaperone function
VDPTSPRARGLAFGRRRRVYVCLDVGLVATAWRDRPSFDAVVLHELAHVRAGDVLSTYLTIAVWRAFLLVGMLPFVAVTLDSLLLSSQPWRIPDSSAIDSSVTWSLLGHAIVMVAMVFLTRAAVLRARELYADAQTAIWTGRSRTVR